MTNHQDSSTPSMRLRDGAPHQDLRRCRPQYHRLRDGLVRPAEEADALTGLSATGVWPPALGYLEDRAPKPPECRIYWLRLRFVMKKSRTHHPMIDAIGTWANTLCRDRSKQGKTGQQMHGKNSSAKAQPLKRQRTILGFQQSRLPEPPWPRCSP